MTTGVLSVVPSFRPTRDLVSLVETLAASGPVLVSDDGSPSTTDPYLGMVSAIPSVEVVRHRRNCGIARGLNDGLRKAQQMDARWLLTVDQDSVIDTNYVARILQGAEDLAKDGVPVGVHGAGLVEDVSGPMPYRLKHLSAMWATEEVVQSGSLWSVNALTAIGGFREDFRSDAVDAAACLALRERGYVVTVNPEITIHHRIGSARQVTVLGRRIMVTHHSPQRFRSMFTNRIRLFPREVRSSPAHAFRTLRRVSVNAALSLWISRD